MANVLLDLPDVDTSVIKPWVAADMTTLVGREGWTVGQFDAFAFARLLAKIGHGLAVAQFGAHKFSPLALDFMFGRTENLSRVVGGTFVDEPPITSVHWLRLRDHYHLPSKRRFLVAHIRLFACIGAPTYHVAVGEIPWAAHLPGMQTFDEALVQGRALSAMTFDRIGKA